MNTAPQNRMSLCRCGSRLRHKHCCGLGAFGRHTTKMFAALNAQQNGRLAEAESLYRDVLSESPTLSDARHMIATTLYSRGRFIEATKHFEMLFDASASLSADAAHNLGLTLGVRLAGRDPESLRQNNAAFAQWLAALPSPNRARLPLVSIVLPSFNHASFVVAALDSVFAQRYRNIELIVIDDGSTDGSVAVIEDALRRCPFRHRLIARENRGAHVTLNEAIAHCNGQYINPLNSDDRFHPDRISLMVEHVAQRGLAWGFSQVAVMDADGSRLHSHDQPTAHMLIEKSSTLDTPQPAGLLLCEFNLSISTGNLFFSKQLAGELAGFRDYRYNHDWDFAIRAVRLSEPVRVSEALYDYRIHGRNTIGESPERARAEAFQIAADYFHTCAIDAPKNPFAPSTATLGMHFVSRFLLQGHGAALSGEALKALCEKARQLDEQHRIETVSRAAPRIHSGMPARLIVITGVLDVVNVLVALEHPTNTSTHFENHLVVLTSASNASMYAREPAANIIAKLANQLFCFDTTTIVDDETNQRWQDATNVYGARHVDSELQTYFSTINVGELWLQHGNGFLHRALMSAFAKATRICFGDGIGYHFPAGYHQRYLPPQTHARPNAIAANAASDTANEFERIHALIPDVYETPDSTRIVASEKSKVLRQLSLVAQCLPMRSLDDLLPTASSREVVLLLTTMSTEQLRIAMVDEVAAYLDYLDEIGVSKQALILIKPHPRSFPEKTTALRAALRASFDAVVALNDPAQRLLPVEAMIPAILEKFCANEPERLSVVAFSTTSLSIPLLFGLRTHFGFGERIVERYFRGSESAIRLTHEATLKAAHSRLAHAITTVGERAT